MHEGHARAVRVVPGSADAQLLLLCEHASDRLPAPWTWPRQDEWLKGTHWTFDLGAAELCEELSEVLSATAVMARFTRLLVDPNRPEQAPTLFRREAEGRPIGLNRELSVAERERRIHSYWRVYHAAVDQAAAKTRAPVLLAVHTYAPEYEGQQRLFEVGVLFDLAEAAAERLAASIAEGGVTVRLNEPYSGKNGYIYSVHRHACCHGRQALEIEVRQDRATDPAFRRELVALLATHRWV